MLTIIRRKHIFWGLLLLLMFSLHLYFCILYFCILHFCILYFCIFMYTYISFKTLPLNKTIKNYAWHDKFHKNLCNTFINMYEKCCDNAKQGYTIFFVLIKHQIPYHHCTWFTWIYRSFLTNSWWQYWVH